MSEEEVARNRKKRIRAGHRASTIRILGQCTTVLATTPIDFDKIKYLKYSLEEKLKTLKFLTKI